MAISEMPEEAVISDDIDACRNLAGAHGAWWCADDRARSAALPFRALVRLPVNATAGIDLEAAFVLGAYRVTARQIKAGHMNVVSLHPMIRHPGLDHATADDHWHRHHGPLALQHHPHMSEYVQLTVDGTLKGPPYDGFALCGFRDVIDLRERFFAGPASEAPIREDVRTFSDVQRSPRRLVAVVHRPGATPSPAG